MALRQIYSCDMCSTAGTALRKNQFAVDHLLVRSLTNGGMEFNLDLCRKHLDQLMRNAVEGPITPAKKVAAKRSMTKENKGTSGGATYVKSLCEVCNREFPTKQGLSLHRVRSGHGRPKGASKGGWDHGKKTKEEVASG